ncbi:MAG: hypothetical protein HRT47_08915 [Candidatus Caenarcaniphilales bacterium]|nr:hypothetical protein [Candidatus Caenarcaniphilales bacterium]
MSQEVNIAALKEIAFNKLKEDFFEDKNDDDFLVDQLTSTQSSFDSLKLDVDQQLATISMLNDLAIIAENIAKHQKDDATKEKTKEYQEKFKKVQETILNELDVPDEFVQLLQVASAGGVEALEQVATWARNTAKEMRNDEEFNKKLDDLQGVEKKLENLSKIVYKDKNAEENKFSLRARLNKAFKTNASEEEYRMHLQRMETRRQEEM